MRHVFAALLLLVCVLAHSACSVPHSPIASFGGEHENKVTKGKPAKLTAVFEGGTGEIDHDLGAVQSGVPIETPPITENTTFELTVTAESGATFRQTVEILVVEAAVIQSFKADKVVRPGQETTLTATFTGGTGTIDNGIGAVESGKAKSTGKLDATKTYTLTVTNEAGDPVTAVAEAEAAVTPVITSFAAPGAVVSRFTPTTLTAVFTGGHGTIDQGVGIVNSNAPATTPKVPRAGATYTLTVTNGFGESTSKTVSVTTKKELFVDDYGGDILVFDADASGDVAPKRVLVTEGLGIDGVVGIHVDGDEVFIANEGGTPGITVFDIAGDGPVKPKRRISGANTKINGGYMFSIFGGELFVADKSSTIKVWDVTANGDVAPKRTLAGAATKLSNAFATWVSDGELYVSNFDDGSDQSSVTVYPVGASGNKAPTRTIKSLGPTGLRVDGDELFALGQAGDITVYNKKTGAKLRKIVGAKTQLSNLYECSIADLELYCASYGNDRILVFPEKADGDVAPTRVIMGEKSFVSGPGGAFVF